MTLSRGSQVGPYEILAPLGAGGMGEVWRARDTRLNRDVALKVLPEILARDPDRMARFKREAQVLASLNHPNIAAIYGYEESDAASPATGGVRALVMELVEGPTLAERLNPPPAGAGTETAHRAVSTDDALAIAQQIAEGLEYAHERGVIHRDLKPANIKITPEGAVKILDFGLAKALDPTVAAASSPTAAAGTPPLQPGTLQDSPTLTAAATQAGVILGTAAYMSPEQARGKPVDRRADIWSFGCVLYEMLGSRKPFEGDTVTDVLAAVIKTEPDWEALPNETPPRLRELIRRCLIKDPKQRLQAIGDARIAIEETISGVGAIHESPLQTAAGTPPLQPGGERRSPLQRALPGVIGLIVGALMAGLVVWRLAAPTSPPAAMHFSAVTNFAGVQAQPALSPDDRSVAFVSNRDGHYNIYVGLVRGGDLVQITHDPNLKSRPSWSPDGTTLAYGRLDHSGIWDIWEVPALGGTPRRVILNATDTTWSPDGHSLAYQNRADGTLWVSGVSGESPHQVTAAEGDEWRHTQPRFSPDGGQIAFIVRAPGPYGELEVVDLRSGQVRQLTHDSALALSPAWSPDGRFVYFASSRGGTMNIWKIAATGGRKIQITAGQGDDAQLDVSSDGKRIVFSTWRLNTNIAQLDLATKPGPQSLKLLTNDAGRSQLAPVYSPDGKHLTYFSNLKGAENESIWVSNADGSNPVQLVRDGRINVFPDWTPDSQHVIYQSESGVAIPDEYRSIPVSGGAPEAILKNATDLFFDVGSDGRLLFRGPKDQVEAFDPRDNKTETLGAVHTNLKWAPLRWSPDGRSIAYIVTPSREDDPGAGLWVDDFKTPPRQIFRGWADWWFARGPHNEIYFIEGKPDLNGVLWKVEWNGQGLARTSATIPMIHSYWVDPGQNSQDHFAVSPDGRHVAFDTQTVLGANIGMIENVR